MIARRHTARSCALSWCAWLLLPGCAFDGSGIPPWEAPDSGDVDVAPADVPTVDLVVDLVNDGSTADAASAESPVVVVVPTCGDGVKNGLETDIDCGGLCLARCADGKGCSKHEDCASTICSKTTSTCQPCAGKPLGGHCFYIGGWGESCDTACASHGGCDLAGTRDYAGSGGSDAQCVAALGLLGLGSIRHQSWSNNYLGCQHCWPGNDWTYWSDDNPSTCAFSSCVTTCTAAAGQCRLVCACNK